MFILSQSVLQHVYIFAKNPLHLLQQHHIVSMIDWCKLKFKNTMREK